jgi:DNA-directed RNA polymerase subunit RPC12/RpoP
MPQIYITAIITTVFSAAILGWLGFFRAKTDIRPALLTAFLIVLPMQPVFFYLIRLPFHELMKQWFAGNKPLLGFLTTFYAPLTEEPAKLVPLLLPFVRRQITRNSLASFAVMIGLGFGIGEMWMVAHEVTKASQFANLAWYDFLGYINERFMVCIFHASFTAFVLLFMRRLFWLGILIAMALHYSLNFPIYLKAIDAISLDKTAWDGILTLFFLSTFFIMATVLGKLAAGEKTIAQMIYGEAKCPACGKIYPRPMFRAVNLGAMRYERCPYCGKWHMTTRYKPQDEGASIST